MPFNATLLHGQEMTLTFCFNFSVILTFCTFSLVDFYYPVNVHLFSQLLLKYYSTIKQFICNCVTYFKISYI